MTVLLGWQTTAASGNVQDVLASPSARHARLDVPFVAEGVPAQVRFIYEGSSGGNPFRVAFYRQDTRALVAHTDLVDPAGLTVGDEVVEPVTSLESISSALTYYVAWEHGGGALTMRESTDGAEFQSRFNEGDGTHGWTWDANNVTDPTPDPPDSSGSITLPYTVLESAGTTPGIRRTLRDTDTGNVAANLTDVTAVVRTAPDTEATLHKTATATTDGDGAIVLSDDVWPVTSQTGEAIGTSDINGDLAFTLAFDNAQASSVTLSGPTETIIDDGSGNLHLSGDATATRGTIDYAAGTGQITGSADTEAAFSAAYDHLRDEVYCDFVDQAGTTVGAGWLSVVADANTTESKLRGEA